MATRSRRKRRSTALMKGALARARSRAAVTAWSTSVCSVYGGGSPVGHSSARALSSSASTGGAGALGASAARAPKALPSQRST